MQTLIVSPALPIQHLVLIGGGEFSFGETREVDEFLLRSMPSERRTVAFIPAASGSAEYAAHIGKYFASIDASVTTINVPIYRGRDGRRGKNATMLRSAGMIYLGGGLSNQLLDPLRDTPSEQAMRDAAADGTVIAAIGAAASCFGSVARDVRSANPLVALDWLRETVIETSFDPEQDTMLRRMMSLPEVRLGLGIPRGAALAIGPGGSTTILGTGKVAAFRKNAGEVASS
jgi:Peptidase E